MRIFWVYLPVLKCTATGEQVGGIRLPAFLPNWQVCQEGQRRQSIPDTSSPGLEITAMVPSIAGAVGGLSPDTSTINNVTVRPIWQTSPFNGNRTAPASHLETIGHRRHFKQSFAAVGSRMEQGDKFYI